jgi:hypothetical protein
MKVRLGMEASGHARWFERLLAELQFELWTGDAAAIRAKRVRKQKTDRQDAQLILRLMLKDDFPQICSFVRIQLEVNSEISGRVILPEGYEYKKSEVGNLFPLFAVEVDTPDGKQVRGTAIGDPLRFAVTGLAPGSYIVQSVNYLGEDCLKMPLYAPGVPDTASALRIELGLAEHRTGLEIRVPPEALKRAH